MPSLKGAVSANKHLIIVIIGAVAALILIKLMGDTISSTLDNALRAASN